MITLPEKSLFVNSRSHLEALSTDSPDTPTKKRRFRRISEFIIVVESGAAQGLVRLWRENCVVLKRLDVFCGPPETCMTVSVAGKVKFRFSLQARILASIPKNGDLYFPSTQAWG